MERTKRNNFAMKEYEVFSAKGNSSKGATVVAPSDFQGTKSKTTKSQSINPK